MIVIKIKGAAKKNTFSCTLIFFIILIISTILFSCKKIESQENKNEFGEAIYTDSFAPKEWENPLGRIKVEATDKDIGKFINYDTIEPRLRKTLDIINDFVMYMKNNDTEKISKILTPSAYNSFILRYNKVDINKEYEIRISYPENIENESMWLDIKLIFPHGSIVSKIELEYLNANYKIGDFENKFFDDLGKMFSK